MMTKKRDTLGHVIYKQKILNLLVKELHLIIQFLEELSVVYGMVSKVQVVILTVQVRRQLVVVEQI